MLLLLLLPPVVVLDVAGVLVWLETLPVELLFVEGTVELELAFSVALVDVVPPLDLVVDEEEDVLDDEDLDVEALGASVSVWDCCSSEGLTIDNSRAPLVIGRD